MTTGFAPEGGRREKTDTILLFVLVLLVGLGLVVLFSASAFKGEILGNSAWYFVQKQLLLIGIGSGAAWYLSRIPLDWVRRAVPWLLLVTGLMMVSVFLPIWDVQEIYGARRWMIKFGQSFQPSELAKLTVVLYLASMFAKKEGLLNNVTESLLPPFGVSFFFVFLALLQNDYSTSMFLLFVILVMFFLADVKLAYFFTVVGAGLIVGVAGVLSAPYRLERILTFLSPDRDPAGASFQIMAARSALEAGGFWGVGLGAGIHKLGGVPEIQNDFIMASVAEENGFWGVCLVFVLFALLAWRGWEVSLAQKDVFARMLGFGITTFLVYQMLINLAVVAGSVPATGVTLPFFSSGGTSILISLLMGGLLLNLSRRRVE